MASLFDTFLSALTQDPSRVVSMPETAIRPEMRFPETVIPPLGANPAIDPESFIGPTPESWDISDADIAAYDAKKRGVASSGDTNLIDLNNMMDAAERNGQPMPAPDKMMPLPRPPINMPVRDLGEVPVPLGGIELASITEPGAASTKLGTAPRVKPVGAGAPPASQPSTPATQSDTPKPADLIADMLGKRRSKYSDDESKARGEAANAEKMTDDDKLAFALLSALPGLIGLVGGGIAGGGLGAAQGLAGGLQGGAAGTQMIADAKTGKRKEALARADKASDRLAQVDTQELHHGETLQGQAFTAGQADKDRDLRVGESEKDRALRTSEHKASIAAQHSEGEANRANAKDLKRMDLFGDSLKAAAAASKAGGKNGPNADLYVNLDSAWSNLKELENTIIAHGNVEGPLGNPKARADLGRLSLDTAIAYAKIVDPESVAREGEVEAGKKYLIPMGYFEKNGTSLEALDGMRKTLMQKATARQHTGQLPQMPPSAQGARATVPAGVTETDRIEGFKWLQANPNDPHAAQVKARLGL